jgi:hypothetical protein
VARYADVWVPISDNFNNWMQLGDAYKHKKASEEGMKVLPLHLAHGLRVVYPQYCPY